MEEMCLKATDGTVIWRCKPELAAVMKVWFRTRGCYVTTADMKPLHKPSNKRRVGILRFVRALLVRFTKGTKGGSL